MNQLIKFLEQTGSGRFITIATVGIVGFYIYNKFLSNKELRQRIKLNKAKLDELEK